MDGAPQPDDEHQAAARQTFSWLLGHALRGATHPIAGALSMLSDEPEGHPLTPRQRELVSAASAATAKLIQLSNDIQTLTHAEARTLEIHAHLTPVTTLVREAMEQAQPSTLGRPPRPVKPHIASALPPVRCDPELIQRALAAVIENALRFSPPDTPVTVDARKHRGRIVIRVRDLGAGISPAEAPHIFDPLYTGERRGKHIGLGLGLGLGLAVARVCVEAHGGSLTLEPNDPPGATFRIDLPLEPTPSA